MELQQTALGWKDLLGNTLHTLGLPLPHPETGPASLVSEPHLHRQVKPHFLPPDQAGQRQGLSAERRKGNLGPGWTDERQLPRGDRA